MLIDRFVMHSAGTKPDTGALSPATLNLLQTMYDTMNSMDAFEHMGHMIRQPFRIVLSGEQTRKSGPWAQAVKLKEYVAATWPWLTPLVDVYPTGMNDMFAALGKEKNIGKIYFFNADVHMERFLAELRLVDRELAKHIVPVEVEVGDAYYKQYSRDYVNCYNAAAWTRLASRYKKKGRLEELPLIQARAKEYRDASLQAVGWWQFLLFCGDRFVNKPTRNPVKLVAVQIFKLLLRKDLLGENTGQAAA